MPIAITVTSKLITEEFPKSFVETILFIYFVQFQIKNHIIQPIFTTSHMAINSHV